MSSFGFALGASNLNMSIEPAALDQVVPVKKKRRQESPSLAHVVGLGASAGGLEALRPLIAGLKPGGACSFIVAQHMAPQYESILTNLLMRETTMTVVTAVHQQKLEPDTIYVTPPDKDIAVKRGRITLRPAAATGPKPSIDALFASLAESYGDRAVGVILSGTGSDGTHGCRSIKCVGGLIITQDLKTAKHDGMPSSVVRSGLSDIQLPVEEIAERLNHLAQQRNLESAVVETSVKGASESSYRFLLDLVYRTSQVDFSQYKEATLSRQIQRRMKALSISTLDAYTAYAQENRDELLKLHQHFLISVTSFFRDPAVFAALGEVIRDIVSGKSNGDCVRIWVPGCATGEEVFSIAMLVAEALGARLGDVTAKIFATDIDQPATEIARHGIYPASSVEQVPKEFRERYLISEGRQVRICKMVRDMCIFSRQDLVLDPPFLRMDLVACRNVLIYFKPGLQEEIISKLHYALNPNGVLLLGRSESFAGSSRHLFSTVDSKQRLFRKRQYTGNRTKLAKIQPFTLNPIQVPPAARERIRSLSDSIQDELLRLYAPASILMTQNLEPLQLFGNAKRYLQVPDGVADFSVLSLCPPPLRTELRTLLQQIAHDTEGDVTGFPVDVMVDNVSIRVRMRIRNVNGQSASERALLLCFEEQPSITALVSLDNIDTIDERQKEHLSTLQEELLGTREHLQAVLEEMHTTNEEFQSLNEELQSSSEELQASNEELQTTNEELQATNEELTTLNDELQARSAELVHLNETLINIQNSIQVGMVLVDRQLRVTRYTPLAVRIFGLLPGDLGQSLLGLPSYPYLPRLREYIEKVIATSQVITEHTQVGEVHYLMQISPYLSETGVNGGAVLAFTDVSELRRVEHAFLEQERRFRNIFENVPTSIWQVNWGSVSAFIDELRASGVADVGAYFRANPQAVIKTMTSIAVLEVNQWTLRMFSAAGREELAEHLGKVFESDESRIGLASLLTAYAVGKRSFNCEMKLNTLNGELLTVLLSIVFPKDPSNFVLMNIVDVSDLRRAESALHESEERFDLILRTTPHGMLVVAEDGSIVRSNAMAQRTFGYSDQEMTALSVEDLIEDGFREAHHALRLSYQHQPRARSMGDGTLFSARHKEGRMVPVEISLSPLHIGADPYVIANIVDVSERLRAEKELRERDLQYRMVIDTSPDGFLMADRDGLVLEVNEAYCHRFKFSIDRLGSCYLSDLILEKEVNSWQQRIALISNGGGDRFEATYIGKNGEEYPIEVTLSYADINGGRIYAFVRDISARKTAEAEIKNLAYYDFLTGLPNRRLLLDRVRQAMAVSHRTNRYGALLFIDIDNFKQLNDTLGHETGDLLLAEVGKRLLQCVRAGDTVARFGGDEFVVMLEGLLENRDVAALQTEVAGSRIVQGLSQPYQLNGHEYHCTPSIGISLFYRHETSVDDLLKQTDLAMYQAKAAGRNAMRFFDEQMQANIDARAHLEAQLRKAIQNDDLQLHYQPQVDVDGVIVGAEALVRWQHMDLGLIMPSSFIPLAEGTSLILVLGQRVIQKACETLALWATNPLTEKLVVSVNVSARQFRAHEFVRTVQGALEQTGAPPNRLLLELTESLLVDDLEDTRSKIETLRAMGVRFSLDDFGTGYSSLSYLKRLPLDQLKIDRAFVTDMLTNHNDMAIVRALVALGNSLGLYVIAEGIETKEQWEFVAREGCKGGQGYFFGKPMPLAEFDDMMRFEH